MRAALTQEDHQGVAALQKAVYEEAGYELSVRDDYDNDSITLMIEDGCRPIACMRLCFDALGRLPADEICPVELLTIRQSSSRIAEIGRFCSLGSNGQQLFGLYSMCYNLGIELGIESYVAILMNKNLGFYERVMGVDTLIRNIDYDYGTGEDYALVNWHLPSTPAKFFKLSKKYAPH